ncbi:SDR family NAD(P)-dependent oxidoreductase [Streptosporangium vulgare]|uniref:SDR family NAD(P)-dependent oxidoreductase n=1 Tax=Streptosporangium vulgare TaxID=46190 RepID=A0ABV5TKP9_9ACTN
MTGASRGIGRIAAERILRQSPDAHLLVVARGSSGAPLAAELREGGHAVSHVEADLGSLESVRSAATDIRDRLERGDLPPLRGFVGNAGMQFTNALTEGPDGLESTFTVNVLANHVFVRLLEDRERASLIVTSNKPFGRWGEVFGDDVVAAAMIDRLVHHAEVISLKGDSCRLKNRGLGRVPAANPSNDQ